MILRSHLIALNQVKVEILKTTNSLIVRVVSNVGLTVRACVGGIIDVARLTWREMAICALRVAPWGIDRRRFP